MISLQSEVFAVIYLETGSLDPCYNLAFEEFVLSNRRDDDYLLLWQNENTVVVGQNQNPLEEIDPDFVARHGIRVVRRITGGGAVYHDLGNLNFSLITDAEDPELLTMELFTAPVVEALRELGVPAEVSGRNDIVVEGQKISGTAQCVRDGRILFHGTLLFDSDPEMLSGALRADPEKFSSKSSKSVRSRVGNIRTYLNEDMDLPAFRTHLRRSFVGEAPAEQLTPVELSRLQKLKEEKYDTWDWTYGRSPQYETTYRRRWEGGTLAVSLTVDRGILAGIAFRGDFLSLKDPAEVETALRGIPYREESVAAVLDRFSLREYFGSITADELLQTIFP